MHIEPFQGQSDKQRLLATLRGEKTDRVPNFEILIEDQHVEKILGRKAGNTLGVGGDPAKGSEAAEGVRPMYPKDYIELCYIIGQDAIALEALWTPIKHKRPDGTIEPLNDRSIKSRKDLDRIVWPGQTEIDERMQYIREYVAAVRGTNIGVILLGGCIFQTLYEFVIGLNDCMIMIMEDRQFFCELMSRSADYYEELFRQAAQAGIDILYPADDFAYNNGLFVRPQVFKEIWQSHFQRILHPVKKTGIPIWFHSDGKIDDAMEMLIDMGIDCVTPMDPTGIDYRDYKKRYGNRITLHGNIDITWPLVQGTPQDVENDVKQHFDVLKPGGRYIAGSSHSIVNYIPHQNFIAMINAFHKYAPY
ncbi:MAG: uroporphyrinogen decarboxylase family protein [Planctomycetota bacterium]|jgi:uroporphyrinogen-III decarboxylase